MTLLSVNVNKVAVLRNSRGGAEPDVLKAARTCIAAGAGGITVHPRPDLRHIRPEDVYALADEVRGVEFNIEGNPLAPPRTGYPGMLALIEAVRPTQATLVPDADGQRTSDHGWRLTAPRADLAAAIERIKALGVRVSLFVDPEPEYLAPIAALGVDRIEIYTGPYAEAPEDPERLAAVRRTAQRAVELGLGVNAGHDLSQANLGRLLAAVPEIVEVSIGHALIGEALYDGLGTTVRNYLTIIARARGSAAPR